MSFSVAPNAPSSTDSGFNIGTPKFAMNKQNATGGLDVNLDSVITGTGVFTVSAYVTLSIASSGNVQVWSVYGNAPGAMKLWHPLAGETADGTKQLVVLARCMLMVLIIVLVRMCGLVAL